MSDDLRSIPFQIGFGIVAGGLVLVTASLVMVIDNWWSSGPQLLAWVGGAMIFLGALALGTLIVTDMARETLQGADA